MSGRYVPPGRRKSDNAAREKPPAVEEDASLLTTTDIREHFWPTAETDERPLSNETHSKTLHDAASSPGQLAYILLFHLANPRWESDRIIFTKSSLDLLPLDRAEDNTQAPADEAVHGFAVRSSAEIDTSVKQEQSTHPDGNAEKTFFASVVCHLDCSALIGVWLHFDGLLCC